MAIDNPGLGRDVMGSVDWRARIVTVVVPPGANMRSLIATYVAPENARVYVREPGGSVVPQTNGASANNFTRPVIYQLLLEDETEVEFVVKVREAETNPNLASMTLGDNVAFAPSFDTEVESYAAEVPYEIGVLKIRPNAESSYATIMIDGKRYGARNATATAALKAGQTNAVSIVVTAEDGVTTRTYTINVTRAEPERVSSLAGLSMGGDLAISPQFSTDTTTYRVVVPYEMKSVTFTAETTSAVATLTVGGKTSTSGIESEPVVLGGGLLNEVEIIVTAQDGTTKTKYVVNVQRTEPDRDSSLAGLTLSEGAAIQPKFSAGVTNYQISIPNTLDTVVFTPVASSSVATIAIGGKALASGTAAAPIVLAEDSATTAEIVVTAQDGETATTYKLEVVRKPLDPTWTQATAKAGFGPRYGFEVVVFKGRLWLIGGCSSNLDFFNDIWYSPDGVTWSKATENPGFAPRRNHQVVEYKGRLWLIGGETGMYEYDNDVWSSKDGVYWTKVKVEQPLPKQVNHQVAVFKGKIWVVGGYGPNSTGHSVWSSSDGKTWSEEVHEAAFPARDMHQLFLFKNKMWIIGGKSGSARYADVWSSADGITWNKSAELAELGFQPRILHETAVFAGRIWVSGGHIEGYGAANDVWYSKNGVDWMQATESAEYAGRIDHQMANFKGKLWILGGTDNQSALSDVWYSNAREVKEKEAKK